MDVLYDYQAFWFQRQGGVSKYFSCLMNAAYENNLFNVKNSTLYSNNLNLVNAPYNMHHSFLKGFEFKGKNTLFFGLKYLNQKSALDSANSKEYDLFHPTYFEDYFLGKVKIPFVLTCHDLTMEKFPNLFSPKVVFKTQKENLFDKSRKIITVSENTKKDLLNLYNVSSKKIDVVYHGSNLSTKTANKGSLNIPKNFILFVGAREGYKNFEFFVSSIKKILLNNKDLYLVCVGKGFSDFEKKLIKDKGTENKVLCVSANDSELAYLYSTARLFVFPSLYEVFGIPILEAFNCGCPVVLSNASCFPEIAENAATYFDPTDSKSIKNCIEDLLSNDKKRELLIKRGFKRAKDFSWEKTALQTKKVYQKALK